MEHLPAKVFGRRSRPRRCGARRNPKRHPLEVQRRRAALRRHPSKGRRPHSSLPRERRDACEIRPPARAGLRRKPRARNEERAVPKAPRTRRQPAPPSNEERLAGFHSSMPRSNPHARERVMDDGKHLDVLARSFPFAGRETSVASSAGCHAGGLSKLPRTQSVTKRCSRRIEPGFTSFSPLRRKGSSTRGARPVQTMQAVRKSGGIVGRTARSLALGGAPQGTSTNENRSDGIPVVLSGEETHSGSMAIRSPWSGPRACGAHRSSEEPTFRRVVLTIGSMWQKSDERRRRRGRAQHRETVAACRSETHRGKPRGASARPPDGRRSGSSVLAAIVTDLRKRVISAARSQTPLAHPKGREGGLLPQAKATRASAMRRRRSGGQAERGDGSVRG